MPHIGRWLQRRFWFKQKIAGSDLCIYVRRSWSAVGRRFSFSQLGRSPYFSGPCNTENSHSLTIVFFTEPSSNRQQIVTHINKAVTGVPQAVASPSRLVNPGEEKLTHILRGVVHLVASAIDVSQAACRYEFRRIFRARS